jgi:zona occludens toxin
VITLITGAPGAGKTAALVDLLRQLGRERPLYVQGLNGLTLPHTEVDATRWHEVLPDGAVLVIDEVQQVWRPRGPSVKPTPDITALETHRHRGIDIFLTTQHPKLLDVNVRALVGRHVHIRNTGWLGRWWYEWPECSDTLAWKSCPVKKRYKLPVKAFGLYKSASEHTSVPRFGSPMLWIAAALLLLFLGLAFMVYRTVSSKLSGDVEPGKPSPAVLEVKSGQGVRAGPASMVTGASMVAERVPRLSAEPESAPRYDHLREVVEMPRVVGGYCIGDRCRCFTQQRTDPGISQAECRAWLAAPPFDAYRQARRDHDERERERAGLNRREQVPTDPGFMSMGEVARSVAGVQ